MPRMYVTKTGKQRWQARVKIAQRSQYLGVFDDKESAAAAEQEYRDLYRPEIRIVAEDARQARIAVHNRPDMVAKAREWGRKGGLRRAANRRNNGQQ